MLLIILSIIAGVLVGLILPLNINSSYSMYFVVGILAALDSVMGAIRAHVIDEFDSLIFTSGFFLNALLAMALAYVGDRLGLPLYYAAIFVFGTRLFSNISVIRRELIEIYRQSKKNDTEEKKQTKKNNKKILKKN